VTSSALEFILSQEADGGTNINEALVEGLRTIQKVKEAGNILPENARQVRTLKSNQL
jgi:uncharacterized protein with von Willebrand factor type A (vWA) domain